MKRRTAFILVLAVALLSALPLASCSGGNRNYKIGILREDDSSGEAAAWEEYLNGIGSEMGINLISPRPRPRRRRSRR